MDEPITVRLRGQGGSVWEFDLPLSEVYQDQLDKGALQPADDEAARLLAGETVEEPATGPADGTIEAVMARVDGNVDRAREALEAEQAKGDGARPRLIAKLEEILTNPEE